MHREWSHSSKCLSGPCDEGRKATCNNVRWAVTNVAGMALLCCRRGTHRPLQGMNCRCGAFLPIFAVFHFFSFYSSFPFCLPPSFLSSPPPFFLFSSFFFFSKMINININGKVECELKWQNLMEEIATPNRLFNIDSGLHAGNQRTERLGCLWVSQCPLGWLMLNEFHNLYKIQIGNSQWTT